MKNQWNFDKIVEQVMNEGWLSNIAAAGLTAGALYAPTNISPDINTSEPTSIVQAEPTRQNAWLNDAFSYIGRNEGLELEPYRDSKGKLTIGVGHLIRPGEDFSNGITREQAQLLFRHDIQEHLRRTRSLFPRFNTYPNYLKVALLDGVFRGEHKARYNTTQLINNEQWNRVADEYLRNNEYLASKAKGSEHGVWQRMDRNADRMRQYARELNESALGTFECFQKDRVELLKKRRGKKPIRLPKSRARFMTSPYKDKGWGLEQGRKYFGSDIGHAY